MGVSPIRGSGIPQCWPAATVASLCPMDFALPGRSSQAWPLLDGARRRQDGLTFIELAIVVAVIGVLSAAALPAYSAYIDKVRVGIAISEISETSRKIKLYVQENGSLPASLADVGADGRLDPWGRPYVYVNLHVEGIGKARKNKNLVPLNSDFDFYSPGKDGDTKAPLVAKVSRDDVLRASDGLFVGLASTFDP